MQYDIGDAGTAGYKQLYDHVLTKIDAETAHRRSHIAGGVQNYDRLHGAYEEFADEHNIERDERVPWLDYIHDALAYVDEMLEQDVFGLAFDNPIGMAAGFDKNARVPKALAAHGFGYVEIGGVTSHPQDGNPRPRMHRVEDHDAVINSMGFLTTGRKRWQNGWDGTLGTCRSASTSRKAMNFPTRTPPCPRCNSCSRTPTIS